ncbi:putative proto-onCogene tyrosine-protein kinase FER [Trichinella spiralis]|uniref:putative proto-onCogene tyrosine-protein kinase FER n=1 Tax=Trichinella spiralis TaxID=6334 RepID=UPI0001EFDB61|nr:putative proto-onCogene tyrosine-protein kinase FER [Trichinella spiralis]
MAGTSNDLQRFKNMNISVYERTSRRLAGSLRFLALKFINYVLHPSSMYDSFFWRKMFSRSRRKLDKGSSSLKDTSSEKSRDETIQMRPYFFGFLPRDDVETLLEKNGDFLVRKTEHGKEHSSEICSAFKKGYFAGDHHYKSVSDLMDDAIAKQAISTHKGVFILKNPVIRPEWIINEMQLEFKETLGEGHFGIVQHAIMHTGNGEVTDVAVKFLKGKDIPLDERKQFFSECRRFRNLKHRNLVRFFGVSVDTKQVKLIMEYCDSKKNALFSWDISEANFNLFYFFSNSDSDQPSEKEPRQVHLEEQRSFLLLCILWDGIYRCRGHCSSSLVAVLRDLAARNCLLKKGLLKISDFGMAREGGIYKIHNAAKPVPIKWTPPDSIRTRIYTEKSDVWSYGILMWEIFTEGKSPYSEEEELMGDRKRLTPPADMPASLVQLMMQCWELSPDNRPAFSTIKKKIVLFPKLK